MLFFKNWQLHTNQLIVFANFTHQLNLPIFTHDCIHFLYNLYINESPRNGKKNKSLRNHHQNTNERGRRRWRRLGAQGPWAGGTRRRHRRRTLSFVFWWWFLKLLFFFPFRGLSSLNPFIVHFGGYHYFCFFDA